jgi:predicted MPP superfamily phosphohydrolase
MILFLLVYVSIYGGVHVYAFMKLKRGLELGMSANLLLALLMLLMVAAPIVVRVLEQNGQEALARGLAYISFMWMALVFIFISASFFFDIYRLIHFLVRHLTHSTLGNLTLSLKGFCLVSLFLAFGIVIYGYFEALNIRTEYITIETGKLPAKIEKIRIAQISDVHLGLIIGKSRLNRIVDKIRQARPDVLVSTGDLVDGQMDSPEKLADMLRNIPTQYGKYAITGNHEFYAGLKRALAFTEKAGFVMLRGEGTTIKGAINIAGVDDPARGPYRAEHRVSEKELLESLPRNRFTLFLKHQPVVSKDSLGLFDLQLSGHTHKGQIFPFSLMTKLAYRMHTGLTKLGNNALLYVSRGSGTWGPPVRFLSTPEVTIIDLVPQG